MKKIKFLLCILGVSLATHSLAAVCEKNVAMLRCGPGTVELIDFKGFVDIDGTTVAKSLYVLGNLDAKNAQLNHVSVRGNTYLTASSATDKMEITGNVYANEVNVMATTKVVGNLYASQARFASKVNIVGNIDCKFCSFHTDVQFVGEINANNSIFLGRMLLNANQTIFSQSKITGIYVKKPTDGQNQTIYLKEGTTAHNITFESLKGVVILSEGSTVTGIVQGGKVMKQ